MPVVGCINGCTILYPSFCIVGKPILEAPILHLTMGFSTAVPESVSIPLGNMFSTVKSSRAQGMDIQTVFQQTSQETSRQYFWAFFP